MVASLVASILPTVGCEMSPMADITTWRRLIFLCMEHETNDSWDNFIGAYANGEDPYWSEFSLDKPDSKWLDRSFNRSSGGIEGCSFTLWTEDFVYFPTVYDGYENVSWVYRDPCKAAKEHV